MDLRATLEELRTRALGAIQRAGSDREKLAKLREVLLGRRGELAEAVRRLGEAKPSERAALGELANRTRGEVEAAMASLAQPVSASGEASFDPTLDPLPASGTGHLNPLTLTRGRLEDIAERMGFAVVEGPEVESEHYNFDCLNTPADHPARDMQDTFWLTEKVGDQRLVLRTQTSSQQVRAMRSFGAPFYGVFPGRVFRNEATDARHESTFDQFEGLVVAKSISVAHLLGTLEEMLNQFFGREVRWRVRPGYFPFVEPGMEMDAACLCDGKDTSCKVCGGSGWLEMIGCGLVHPKVLEAGGLDPAAWSGFAFGIGFSRLVMLAYGVSDIRLLAGNDWRFIKQFPASV